jgi:adenine-specific DNA-methyltransferase
MAKIEITKTELVWPGKYNEDGTRKEVPRASLPFQVIETVNESRATREAKKGGTQTTLFDIWEGKEGDTFEDGWRNKLILDENHSNRKIESHRLQIGGISNTIRAL